jgi:hypothetical protein
MPVARATRRLPARGVVLAAAWLALAGGAYAQDAADLRGTVPEAPPAAAESLPPATRPKRIGTRPYVDGRDATRRSPPAPLARTAPPSLTPVEIAPPRRRPLDPDPFAAPGVKWGAFRLRPALEFEAGFDTNPNRTAGGKGSARLATFGELVGDAEWARHAAAFRIRGGYLRFPADASADRPELDAKGTLRLDLRRDLTLDADAGMKIDTQSPFTTNLPFATARRPLITTLGAGIGVTQAFGRFTVGLRGSVDRSIYADAETGGGFVDQSHRDVTALRGALRLGYEAMPGLKPFLEARVDTRRYDVGVDPSGFRRASDGLGLRGGATIEFTRLLTGEISAGMETRRYADPALADLRGFVGEASLVWSASALTTVKLRGTSSLDETTVAGLSGQRTHAIALQVDHDFRRWLTGSALISLQRASYGAALPSETTLAGTLRLDYKLSRTMVLRASFTHERFSTATAGRDYTASALTVGLRLQR